MTITYRRLESQDDVRQCVAVQIAAWDMDPVEVMPHHFFTSVIKIGGLMIGAFDGEQMVGFIYTLPSLMFKRDRATHEMDMLAVLPEYQRHGIAWGIFEEYVRELALHVQRFNFEPLISGTFDPFLGQNAHLYIRKLGSLIDTFVPNMYGEIKAGIYAGLRTDRFQTILRPLSPHTQARMRGAPSRYDVPYAPDGRWMAQITFNQDRPTLKNVDLSHNQAVLYMPMPYDIAALKQSDLGLARTWQDQAAEIFAHYIGAGWIVTDFLRQHSESGQRYNVYVFRSDIDTEG